MFFNSKTDEPVVGALPSEAGGRGKENKKAYTGSPAGSSERSD